MSRIIASITTAALLALAACGAPKTEEAAPDTTMSDPITTEVPAITETPPVDETMAMPTEPMPTEPMATEPMPTGGEGDTAGDGEDDADGPGNAGNDKGRAPR